MVPAVGATIPSRSLSRVDLPEPLAPSSADPLAALDPQVDPVERDLAAAVDVAHAVQLEHRLPRRRGGLDGRLGSGRHARGLGRHGTSLPITTTAPATPNAAASDSQSGRRIR